MKTPTFTIVSPDGSAREVSEVEFQATIDRSLAKFNDGKIPTTDEERTAAIAAMRRANQ